MYTSFSFHYYHMLLFHYHVHSGGVKVVFTGSNLNVTQSPMIIITDSSFTYSLGVRIVVFLYHYMHYTHIVSIDVCFYYW